MEGFTEVNLQSAYEMLAGAKTILVCTKGKNYNVTPYGWFTTYDYEPVTKVLISSDPNHQAAINIHNTQEFAICIPKDENDPIINKTGSVSAPEADKFAQFDLKGVQASKIDVKVLPENSKGIIEFKLVKILKESTVELILGEAVAAFKAI